MKENCSGIDVKHELITTNNIPYQTAKPVSQETGKNAKENMKISGINTLKNNLIPKFTKIIKPMNLIT